MKVEALGKSEGAIGCRVRLLAVNLLYSLAFTMFLAVAPVMLERRGAGAVSGLANTAFLAAAVTGQWSSPFYLRRWSHRSVSIVGLLLMAVPTPFLAAFDFVPITFALNTARGLGFGILSVVAVPILVPHYPAASRGRALGHFGVATSISAMAGPSLGLALLEVSEHLVVSVGAAAPLLALGLTLMCSHRLEAPDALIPSSALLRMLRNKNLGLYAASFVAVSIAWGGTVSFLPMILGATGAASASTFLLSMGVFRIVGRWAGGVMVDKIKDGARLTPYITATMVIGLIVLAISQGTSAVLISSVIYGAGVGAYMTIIYELMIRESPYGVGTASALWASSIDFGGVLGTALLTAVFAQGGSSAVLWAMPLLVSIAIPAMLWRDPISDGSGQS